MALKIYNKKQFIIYFIITAQICLGLGSPQKNSFNIIKVNKCCEKFEILVDLRCTNAKETNSSVWSPIFTGYNGEENVKVSESKTLIGLPACGSHQMWSIYDYPTSVDKLVILPDGKLRHFIKNLDDEDDFHQKDNKESTPYFYDHEQGQYCMDKSISSTGLAKFAMVCSPERVISWTDPDFLFRKIINPICHGLSITTLLIIAIIYFVLPTLRDLIGNIITTITLCLIVSQAANLVRIFTEFTNHVSFMVADIILYVSLLAAFFWLNSMGYYIWKTFKSRNVFLRVTDGRKYCWYSSYAWGSSLVMAGLAVFAHFFLDSDSYKKQNIVADQDTIGWLGIAIFFTPIAFIIIINLFFYVTTLKIINRMNTYGRIHHKLKSNFVMFSLLFLVMSIAWIFLILSWLNVEGLLYTHIIVNALQAPLILYICVLRQKHVTFLLKKSCCYNEPPSASDWGDEMTYMDTANF